MLRDSLAAAERARNRGRAASGQRAEHVQNPHARQKRQVRVELARDRTGATHRPVVVHLQFRAVLEGRHDLFDGVATGWFDASNLARDIRWHEDLVREAKLRHSPEARAALDLIADRHAGREVPELFSRQRLDVDASSDEIAGCLADFVQRALNTVEDAVEHSGPKFHGQRQVRGNHVLADRQTVGVFVNLHEADVAVQANDLADELLFTDANNVVHFRAVEVLDEYRWPGNFLNFACHSYLHRSL